VPSDDQASRHRVAAAAMHTARPGVSGRAVFVVTEAVLSVVVVCFSCVVLVVQDRVTSVRTKKSPPG
jgi:hypothetical protein